MSSRIGTYCNLHCVAVMVVCGGDGSINGGGYVWCCNLHCVVVMVVCGGDGECGGVRCVVL